MRKKRLQKIVALFMVVAMVLNLTPSGLAISAADDEPATVAEEANGGTSAVKTSDALTNTDWEDKMSTDASGNGTSEEVGRIWTDKTVSDSDITLTYGDIEGETIEMTDGADFLVELSALGSTSSLDSVSAQPLDIVLVLDVSGSMSDNITTYSYTETYTVSSNSSYYILVDGTYTRVTYTSGSTRPTTYPAGWYYTDSNSQRQYVDPMTSATDTDNVQFYTQSSTTTTRLKALQNAVNSFIEATAKMNDNLATADQHRISLVTFSGGSTGTSQIVSSWETYTSTATSTTKAYTTLTATVNALTARGATRADQGMSYAKELLGDTYARTDVDAQQVVIFFTDGVPTTSSSFSETVADSAISYAKDMKDAGALIYSVAVYSGADPTADIAVNPSSDVQRINKFLHAVSSNYPSATKFSSLGTRAENSDYYKVASDADELLEIFEDIFAELSTAAASPTHVEDAQSPNAGGYVTFTDELGSFMEVKDFNAIVLEEQTFTTKETTSVEGVADDNSRIITTTYTFEGDVTGNVVYEGIFEGGSLADIQITVVSYPDDPSKGDVVTVKIPATLLPLLYYQIDIQDGDVTMTIQEDYPIRVFYSVGLKADVADAMESGVYSTVDGLLDYVEKNTQDDGMVYFYSNTYSGTKVTVGAETATIGDTTAVFMPASTNSFYYFQSDTPIYTDAACTIPAATVTAGETYYYKHTYYSNLAADTAGVTLATGANAVAITEGNSITLPTTSNWEEALDKDNDGNYYIKSGYARLSVSTSVEFQGVKTDAENATETAKYYLYPTWTGGGNAETFLGNNGRIGYVSTGALDISKTVVSANSAAPAPANKTFTFTVNLASTSRSVDDTYEYYIVDASGNYYDTSFNVIDTTDANATIWNTLIITNGSGTLTLKDGLTAHIAGISDGTTYSITETAVAGFTTTISVDGTAVSGKTSADGTITGGVISAAAFTNTYSVQSKTVTSEASVTKTLSGRDWNSTDTFYIRVVPVEGTTILPTITDGTSGTTSWTVSTVQVDDVDALQIALTSSGTQKDTAVGFGLGNITFTQPGTYTYRIYEYHPVDAITGVTYSYARYTLKYVVTDNGNGTLSVTESMLQMTDDLANQTSQSGEGVEVADKVAAFTNTYSAESEEFQLRARKTINGGIPEIGAFDFKFTALAATDTDTGDAITDNDSTVYSPIPTGVTTTTNTDGTISWTRSNVSTGLVYSGVITVTTDDIGNTYSYIVEEIEDPSISNMTYDSSKYLYVYEVYSDDSTGTAVVTYDLSIYEYDETAGTFSDTPVVLTNNGDITFENTSDTTIGGDDDAYSIDVTKVLTGRDWDASGLTDSFTFTLTPGTNASTGEASPMPTDVKANGTAEVTITSNSKDANGSYVASFGEITYTAVGSYTYTITENLPSGATAENGYTVNGVTYDTSTITVTVTVSADSTNRGALYVSSVTYS